MAAWAWATASGRRQPCPPRIASAASWDLNEATKYGTVIGTELRDYGMNVNLGGNINLIGREPRDGRTFETKGEDPILAGKITAAHINAIQAQHIIGGIKHYAFNDQESGRTTANVHDRRTRRARERSAGLRNRRQGFQRAVGDVLLQPGQRAYTTARTATC